MKNPVYPRRPTLAVIGNAGKIPNAQKEAAFALGKHAVERGFRIVCGGMDGVMEAAAHGAHHAENYQEGDTVGVAMSYRAADLNPWVDIVIPTGMGFARNTIVVSSGDVVVAIGGGSGTLSEIALAWQIDRPILVYGKAEGWAKKMAGVRLDRRNEYAIEGFDAIEILVDRAWEIVQESRKNTPQGND